MPGLHFECRLRRSSGFELNACFDADDGVTALFGPSGSGKSTAFALIAGIQRPDDGSIRLGDRTLVDTQAGVFMPPEQRRIGVVFQDHLLFPHLSVEQNLRFGLGRPASRAIDLRRVAEILEIGELLPRPPHTLSGGQRQRVALGRALLRGPDLLLMDEPLTGLDEGLKDRVLTYLERVVAEWRLPTLFVSHDQADVRRLADRVVILEGGQVIGAGPMAQTLDRAVLTKLKQPPGLVNLLRVTDLHYAENHWSGQVGDHVLHLPPVAPADGATTIYVQFLPQDVALSVKPVSGMSTRNQLGGQVRELVPLTDRVFVVVDIGQFLWAEVTPAAARDLHLQPGQPITCHLKTSALHVVG